MYYLCTGTDLYSLDINTLVATFIGPFNLGAGEDFMIDLCFDYTGTCYGYELVTGNAYTINTSTGAATLLGSLGFDPNFGQGMGYDFETGWIYLTAFNNGTFVGIP